MEKDKGIFSFRKHLVGELLDGKKERKRKMHRALGMLLAAALIFNTLPASGFAVSASEQETGLCEHHRSHTAECGYKEAQPCTHEHGEECYKTVTECVHKHTDECYSETVETEEGNATASDAESREPSNCTHQCSEESGCITKVLDCHHEHDESCGYNEAQDCGYICEICNGTEPEDTDTNLCAHHREHTADCGYLEEDNTPCEYKCHICLIEELIAALPDTVTEDNADDVRARLDEILDLYRELTKDEQEEIDLSRCYALQEALDAANAPMTADGYTEQQSTDEASVTIGEETLYYATLEEAFAAANGKTATITMLTDAECVHSGSAGSPLNINGGNVTLNLNGNTLSGKGYGNYGIINVSGGSLLVQGEEGKVKVTGEGLSCRGSGRLAVEDITLNLITDTYYANTGVSNQGGTVILNGTKITGAASD